MAVSLELFDEYEKKEKCGVFGIWGPKEAAQIAYQGIFAQQHRGQESAGIAVSDGADLSGHAGMGLVSQVFNPRMLREELAGHAAIGHVRYSTTGSSKLCNAQPLLRQYLMGPVAVAHNGNLINAALLRADQIDHADGVSEIDWLVPIVADMEAGFGGHLNVSLKLVLSLGWIAWGMAIVSLLALVHTLRHHAASSVAAVAVRTTWQCV